MRRALLIVFLLLSLSIAAQDNPSHGDGADDVLRFVPVASVFALKACGVEGASSWNRLAVNTAASYVFSAGVAWGLKHTFREERPDHSDRHSFPSGHATFAFAGAHIIYKEYHHDESAWKSWLLPVAGYGVATAVSIDRVSRDRHHWHDVAAGAAIGILGTELGYRLGDLITGESSRYQVAVGPQSVSLALWW